MHLREETGVRIVNTQPFNYYKHIAFISIYVAQLFSSLNIYETNFESIPELLKDF